MCGQACPGGASIGIADKGARLLWVALIIGCAGLNALALLWNELLGEFYHTG
jgi:hypothetical protein